MDKEEQFQSLEMLMMYVNIVAKSMDAPFRFEKVPVIKFTEKERKELGILPIDSTKA